MTSSKQPWTRGLWPVLLLVVGALFIHTHSRAGVLPAHKPLNGFPDQIGVWSGTPVVIPEGDLRILGPGYFLERRYQDPRDPLIDLFIAYFPKQTTGDTIHSPKHCLPGSGWTPFSSKVIHVPWGNGKVLNANYYALELGSDREVAIYWFQAHGRTVASEYWEKFYLISDALRTNRTDGALVRVITPLAERESLASGEDRAISFTKLILPLLGKYIPR
ncbi:MAG: exosortase C-terminal domain/associated protein EpsI [Terriglobia bacterium]